MVKYRKKPVVIEAAQLLQSHDGELYIDVEDLPLWLNEALESGVVKKHDDHAIISTLEGDMRASHGDWIIRDVKDELYPCRDDIFCQTYERADPVTITCPAEAA